MKNYILFSLMLVISAAAGFGLQRNFNSNETQNLPIVLPDKPSNINGKLRPEFAIKDIENKIRNINEWDGKVILINFWATWCPPCKKEIPAFIALQNEYLNEGFQVIGIAIDEQGAVKDYALKMAMNYPIMAAEQEAMDLSRRYGNHVNALPYSAFIGRDGKIAYAKAGELSKEKTESILKTLL